MREIPLSGQDRALSVGVLSDVGCLRRSNEDSLGVFPGEDPTRGCLLVVADGMGGAAGGEVASRLAVETLERRYFRPGPESPEAALRAAMEEVNEAILAEARRHPRLRGMGTTCTAVAVVDGSIRWAHVGDSRAYLLDGRGLRQITSDHSLAAEFERKGGRGEMPARARNVLTRCLGVQEKVSVDAGGCELPADPDAAIVLCTDGLTGLVEDGEILRIVSMYPPDTACRRLVQLARERGAPDNVTVQVARVTETPAARAGSPSRSPSPR